MDDTWNSAVWFLLGDLSRIKRLQRAHKPEKGVCWTCSQNGEAWPCMPIRLARDAAAILRDLGADAA